MSRYEKCFADDDTLMNQLGCFVDDEGECCVWHRSGRYKDLFCFLAARFLSAPDSVLACEGVHAKWKWLTTVKRNIKFKTLNALLKLFDYHQAMGTLPDADDVLPHLLDVSAAHRAELAGTAAGMSLGSRSDYIYRERFNLRACDVDIVKEVALALKPADAQTPVVAWGFYVRFLFQPQRVYQFRNLTDDLYLYIAANKSFAGRDAPATDHAVGRPLSVCWLRRETDGVVDSALGGDLVVSVDDGDANVLPLTHCTVAEISRAAGFYPPVLTDATERSVELLHERHFLEHNLVTYDSVRARTQACPWAFSLVPDSDAADIEDAFFEDREFQGITKMAMARVLQLRHGLSSDERDDLWKRRTKPSMAAEIMGVGAAVAAAAGAAAGRGAAAAGVAAGRGARGGRAIGRGRGAAGGRGGGAKGRGKAKGDVKGGRGVGAKGRGRAIGAGRGAG
jgi:hypothetical protein